MGAHGWMATVLLVAAVGCDGASAPPKQDASAPDLVFVAVENDGAIAIVDGEKGTLVETLMLMREVGGTSVMYHVHNVQGAPDGARVWASAMPMDHGHGTAGVDDVLVGIDVASRKVSRYIDLGEGVHPAHIVISGRTAFVTANAADALLVVDLETGAVTRTIDLPPGSEPHGARLTPDGRTLVVAAMGSGAIELVDLASGGVETFSLPAGAVQTAVLPDGSAAFATIFVTGQVARLDLRTKALELFDLPASSHGPVQLYPTPDGRSLWVADQGILGGRPAGRSLYRLDASTGVVDLEATVAAGPHGVVVDRTGERVWTASLGSGVVQSVDAATGEVVSTVDVGSGPNGITFVFDGGAMP